MADGRISQIQLPDGKVYSIDEKIKLTEESVNNDYPIIFGPASISSDSTYQGYYNEDITINPSTESITATNFVGTLNGTATGNVPNSRTINGKSLGADVTLTASDVGAAASNHVHGNITNDGNITATAPTIASGDRLVINDSSASKITNGPEFDGSTTTLALTPKGTWETFLKSYTEQHLGTVTSIAVSGSNGISISGSPITDNGTIAIDLNLSTAINGLGEGSSPAQRDDYIVAQYAGGGTTTTTYHRRKLSNIFKALNSGDITTALGYTPYNSSNPNGYTSNAGTVTKVSTGVGLTGGDVTTSGTIKANLTSDTALSNAALSVSEDSNRIYPVRVDKNSKLVVVVPWTNVNSSYLTNGSTLNAANLSGTIPSSCYTNTTYSAGTGLSLSSTTFSVNLGYTTSGNNRAVQADSNGKLYVVQKDDNTTYSSQAAASGGTAVSLVTTGEKYTWNNKLNLSGGTLTGRLTTADPINQIITGSGTAASDKGADVSPRYFPAKWVFNTGQTATNGDIITIKIPVAGHSYGVFLSINNGTNYHPVVVGNGTGRLTTHYGNGTPIQLIFDSSGSAADMFALNGADARATVTGGVWRVLNFYTDGNTIPQAYCSTAAATAAKAASMSGYVATANRYVMITMTTANSSATAITMNINGTGAKAIYINGGASSTSNYTLPAGSYLVFYDGTNYYFRTDGYTTARHYNEAPASEVTRYPLTTSVTGVGMSDIINTNTRYWIKKGTTSVVGYNYLALGNATASGADNNSQGYIRLYGQNTGYSNLTYANSTSNVTNTLPATSGTLLNTAGGQQINNITTLYREGTTANNYPAGLKFKVKDTTTGQTYDSGYLYAYQDHGSTTYGVNFVLNGGGGLFIGSGESPGAHYSAKGASYTGEDTFITADGTVYIQANGNTIANRLGFYIDTSQQVIPCKAETATNNVGSLGTSSYKWANLYVTNINGVAVGTTPKFTDSGGTVTSITLTQGDGISIGSSGTAITTSGSRTIALATSGATAGSYGPSANASPAHSGTFSVPYVTVDKYGRVTAISTKTITLPASGNTDTKLKLTSKTDSVNYKLALGPGTITSGTAYEGFYYTDLYYNPSTKILTLGPTKTTNNIYMGLAESDTLWTTIDSLGWKSAVIIT